MPPIGVAKQISRPVFAGRLAGAARRPIMWLTALVAAAVLAFLGLVVRPFETVPEIVANDVATAWNNSISLLGVLPVYPPQEDLFVGDLWAVVAESDEKPILGQAVRIGHIDMRADMLEDRRGQPVFADTADLDKGGYRRGSPYEAARHDVKDDRIALSLTAFPGITITHSVGASAGLTSGFAGLGGKRAGSEREEINIPVVETYGVSAVRAFGRLDALCQAEATSFMCTDEYARRTLQFVANSEVTRVKDGQYVNKLQLRLVTRVFLTREIRQRRIRQDSRDGHITVSDQKSGGDAAKLPQPTGGGSDAPLQSATRAAGSIAFEQGGAADMSFNQLFQRPVAIGYRAVTIALHPSTPAGVTP